MIILNKTAYTQIILITNAITNDPVHGWCSTSIKGEVGGKCGSHLRTGVNAGELGVKNPHWFVLENISAGFSINFLLLLCLHILSEQVTLVIQAATGIDWWKN